jgi:hypothetical protein
MPLDTIGESLAKIEYRWLRVKKVVVKKSMILEGRERMKSGKVNCINNHGPHPVSLGPCDCYDIGWY